MTRIPCIDILRGLVMVLMTIDHAQDYQPGPGLGVVTDPLNLDVTPFPVIFFRLLSHFCAPVFALLAGVSAYLSASHRLATRGLTLIALEFTVVNWSWTFNPFWHRYFFQVIGALGFALLCLSFARSLPRSMVATIGVALTALHNLFDDIRFDPSTAAHYVWSLLHQKNVLPLGGGFEVRTTYPVIPIIGLVFLGYAIGPWLRERSGPLRGVGLMSIALFVFLRSTGLYGDPFPYDPTTHPWLSFFNVTKYPLSLQFALMTIGPALLLLAWTRGRRCAWLEQLGRTPLFYYIAHLLFLHAAVLGAALLAGYSYEPRNFGGVPSGFGFPVWATAPFGIITALLLQPLCGWYERFSERA